MGAFAGQEFQILMIKKQKLHAFDVMSKHSAESWRVSSIFAFKSFQFYIV